MAGFVWPGTPHQEYASTLDAKATQWNNESLWLAQ